MGAFEQVTLLCFRADEGYCYFGNEGMADEDAWAQAAVARTKSIERLE